MFSDGVCMTLLLVAAMLAPVLAEVPTAPPAASGAGVPPAGARVAPELGLPYVHPHLTPPHLSAGTTVIEPNGSVDNSSAPISVDGNEYTFTGSFQGTLVDERNGSTILAEGKTLSGGAGDAPELELWDVHEVMVLGLQIVTVGLGILVSNAQSVTLRNVTVGPSADIGVSVLGSSTVEVSNGSFTGSRLVGISIAESTGLWLTSNNASDSADGVEIQDSTNATLVGNVLGQCAIGVNATEVSGLEISSTRLSGVGTGILLSDVLHADLMGDAGTSGGYGLQATRSSFVNASRESFSGFGTGVSLASSSNISIADSTLISCANAIEANSSGSLEFQSNNLSDFTVAGLTLSNVSNAQASLNVASSGTGPQATAFLTVDDREVTEYGNVADGDPFGIVDIGSAGLTLNENLLVGSGMPGPAISLQGDGQTSILRNSITNASGTAIALDRGIGTVLSENSIIGAGVAGIVAANSTGVELGNTSFKHTGAFGLELLNCTGVTLWGNAGQEPSEPSGDGVFAYGLTTVTAAFNNLTGFHQALSLANTTGATAVGNNLTHSAIGLTLSGDAESLIAANGVWDDSLAFSVAGNLGVAIYHNNFGNDSGWVGGAGPQSIAGDAGYPEGGNFWSNHTGPDVLSGPNQSTSGSDGIVDTPLALGPLGTDGYPLTAPWVPNYAIFTESGLLLATSWSLVINGARFTADAPGPIIYPESNAPNATISWEVPPLPGFSLSGPATGGPWSEPRSNLSFTITYFADRYSVVFQEYGLAPDTPWTLVLGSLQEGGDTASLTISLTNGTYSYLAGTVPGYNLTVGAGLLTVTGPGALIVVVYVALPPKPMAATYSLATVEELVTGITVATTVAIVSLGLLWRARRRVARRPPPLRASGPGGGPTEPPP
ncbi:MAG: right-handed parallel beta-helix repeat-containing protein [Thermoplasmata archaeon]|nr:right-handed parallel beta-helix repeat-containing protein [Thermoplasmata archaeon]